MRKVNGFLFILFFFITIPAHAAIVISELYPKTSDPSQSFVELYNTGGTSVSLDRWKIDHTADTTAFILPANAAILPHSFLTYSANQSAIQFSTEGDTVRLFNENGTMIDSQSYPGTLGYNTSMGRSDGTGTWTICSIPSYNTPNDCPEPPPQPTATSTPTPLAKPDPAPQETPTPLPTKQVFAIFLPTPTSTPSPIPIVLGATTQPTPTPDPSKLTLTINKFHLVQVFIVLAAWAAIALTAFLRKKYRR